MTATPPTLLLTRPRAQAERFADQCRARLGADVAILISPVMTIRYRDVAVDMTDVAGVIGTSVHGLEALARLVDVTGRRAFCVGDRTAAVAEALGMRALSARGEFIDLVNLIRATRPEGRLLHVSGAETRGDFLAEEFDVRRVVLYDQVATDLTKEAQALLLSPGRVVLPLFSPRSADLLRQAVVESVARLEIVALSPAVARAWTGQRPHFLAISDNPDAESMLNAVSETYARSTT